MSWRPCHCLLRCLIALSLLGASAWAASLGDGEEILHFKNGDRLMGRSLLVREGVLHWERPDGQRLQVPLAEVQQVETAPPPRQTVPEILDSSPPSPAPLVTPPVSADSPPLVPTVAEQLFDNSVIGGEWTTYVPLYSEAKTAISSANKTAIDWTRRIQFGGNFTDGNQNNDNTNLLIDLERSTPVSMRQMDLGGQWAQAAGRATANRWWLNTNFDWPLREGEKHWITFLTGKNEYNEFAGVDYRGTVSTGLGYRFFNEGKKRLITRFGPAFTTEILSGVDNDRFTPDIFGEAELRWPLLKRLSLEHKIRVQPSVLDFELVRVFSNSGVLVDLDEKDRWKLRLDLRYEYVSIPNAGRVPSDYFTTLSLVYQRK